MPAGLRPADTLNHGPAQTEIPSRFTPLGSRSSDAVSAKRQEELRARFDRLPAEVKRAAHEGGFADEIDVLDAAALVYRACLRMGGQNAVPIYAADVGRALQVETKRAEALLGNALSRGLIRQTKTVLGGGWYRPTI